MIDEAAEEKLPPFDLVDFIKKDKHLFVSIIGIELIVGIGKGGQVMRCERTKPVVFKIDVKEAVTGKRRNGMRAEMIDDLMDKACFSASAGPGYGNDRRGRGQSC
jgi:hypothetical protein